MASCLFARHIAFDSAPRNFSALRLKYHHSVELPVLAQRLARALHWLMLQRGMVAA
jgi:hypothetical protein